MNIPMLDVVRMHKPIRDQLAEVLLQTLDSGRYINGPAVESFEKQLAEYCQVDYAVGVSSGTDALITALMAFDIKAGDEIITTPYTFFATAGSIHRVGAKPVFADIDPRTYTLDPAKIEQAITPKTVGIIPVHLFGQCADMRSIMQIADKHNIWVLEDAAQSIGSTYNDQHSGSIGNAGIYSFFPAKNLGGIGDGGAVVTKDETFAKRLKSLRNHGQTCQYHHDFVGGNFRLDAIQAAALSVKLPHLDGWVENRRKVAAAYTEAFADIDHITTPVTLDGNFHVCNQYVIRITNGKRDAIKDKLQEAGIASAIYYPVPLHLQQCFSHLEHKQGDFPESERAAKETLALPVDPGLTPEQQEQVIKTILN